MDTPNRTAQYFDRRRREERITARSHRRPKPYARPGAARVETIIPKTDWRGIAAREAATASAQLLARAYSGQKLEAQARAFVTQRMNRQPWAIRGAGPDWVRGQMAKSALHHCLVGMVTRGLTAVEALRAYWDRAMAGDPPTPAELEAMARAFAGSL